MSHTPAPVPFCCTPRNWIMEGCTSYRDAVISSDVIVHIHVFCWAHCAQQLNRPNGRHYEYCPCNQDRTYKYPRNISCLCRNKNNNQINDRFKWVLFDAIIYIDVIQWRQNWSHFWYDAHPTSIQLRGVQQTARHRKERVKNKNNKKKPARQKSKRWFSKGKIYIPKYHTYNIHYIFRILYRKNFKQKTWIHARCNKFSNKATQ